jgi:hypothetical protein
LIENGRDFGDGVYDVIGRDVILMMTGGKMSGGDSRKLHFVVTRRVKTDGVGVGWAGAHLS